MASYKRRREDENTFGFGRYPKRSKRDYNDNDRAYHSMSVNRVHCDRKRSKLNGIHPSDSKFYHFSLSSELFARHSNSQRFSSCSNGHGTHCKHQRGVKHMNEVELKKKTFSGDEPPTKRSHFHSRVCFWGMKDIERLGSMVVSDNCFPLYV